MSSRRVRGPVRQSVRGRPTLDRGKSWEEPDRDASRVRPSTFKHCCRSVATFMCTQVGVGGIIVCYALVGASVFTALEANDPENAKIIQIVDAAKGDIARTLLEDYRNNQFEKSKWEEAANNTLFRFQV
jgi:potassium channel subfamily K protein